MAEGETWVWFKAGDHVDEGHRLCQKCANETHNPTLTAELEVRRVQKPDRKVLTFIFADGPWWREQMRVHPNGWQGQPWPKIVAKFDL